MNDTKEHWEDLTVGQRLDRVLEKHPDVRCVSFGIVKHSGTDGHEIDIGLELPDRITRWPVFARFDPDPPGAVYEFLDEMLAILRDRGIPARIDPLPD